MSTNLLRAYLNGSNLFEFPELTGKQLNSASSGNSLCYVYRENNIKTLSFAEFQIHELVGMLTQCWSNSAERDNL